MKLIVFLLILACGRASAQEAPNWNKDQLIEPSDLSAAIKSNKDVPVIFSVGPGAIIPSSKDLGMAKEAENLQKFRNQLSGLPKDTAIVVYCGCCPFERCPNVRPAIQLLKELGFTNYRLLDLPHNIKIDWIDKGYPVSE
jgi:hypothetical protein